MAASFQAPVPAAKVALLTPADRRRLRVRELACKTLGELRAGLDPADQRELDAAAGDHAASMLNNIRAKAHRAGEGK